MHVTAVQNHSRSGGQLFAPYASVALLGRRPRANKGRTSNMLRMRFNAAGLFTAGGGEGGTLPAPSSRFSTKIAASSSSPSFGPAVEVESHSSSPALSATESSRHGRDPSGSSAGEGDVPQIVHHNGQRLTFGDYRRPIFVERAAITLTAVVPIAWKAVRLFRRLKRNWAKATVAVVAPCLAWFPRKVLAYFYRQTVLQPKLREPESVAFPNSRFQKIDGLKVHMLRESPGPRVAPKAVLHMNHGFGASSSSWSPVIQQMSWALDAIAVAHDTPGFGLTDRPGLWRAEQYSLRNNAAITQRLIEETKREIGASSTPGREFRPNYVLMGHSMGCITAATAALDPSLPAQDTVLVLIAPALAPPSKKRGNPADSDTDSNVHVGEFEGAGEEVTFRGGGDGAGSAGAGVSSRAGLGRGAVGTMVGVPVSGVRAIGSVAAWVFNWCFLPLLYPIEVLALRSIVYRGNFWRAGLRLAWFNKAAVTVDLINRYRWPSLVRNWDRGMAMFLLERAQVGRGGAIGPRDLVESIAAKAEQGMKVILIQGENDKLINLEKVQKGVLDHIPGAKLVVMKDCGHVPHEEKPEEFLRIVNEELGGWAMIAEAGAANNVVEQEGPPS